MVDIDVPWDMVNYGPTTVRALAENPDAMYFSCSPPGIAQTLVELHRRGWTDNSKNLLFESAIGTDLWEIGKGYLDGCRIWIFYNDQHESPIWQDMVSGFQEEYGSIPSFMTYGGFDEVYETYQCFEALKITGDPARSREERIAIRDWLNNPTPDGEIDTCFGTSRIVNGLRLDPAWLFTIVEDPVEGGEMTDAYACPQEYWKTHDYPSLQPYVD